MTWPMIKSICFNPFAYCRLCDKYLLGKFYYHLSIIYALGHNYGMAPNDVHCTSCHDDLVSEYGYCVWCATWDKTQHKED